MLIRESISGYKHINLGSIKLAFTQVCKEEMFKGVYFAANSLYYVESGTAILYSGDERITIEKEEICLIRQHSKLDIRKYKDKDGKDFKSIIFYLFPDFVTEFTKHVKKNAIEIIDKEMIQLGRHLSLKLFCESLLPSFENKSLIGLHLKRRLFLH